MSEQLLAGEQFARDISLVLDNDHAAYLVIQAAAKRLNSTYELAEFIRDYVEESIIRAMRHRVSDYSAGVGTLLIAQLCTGWGIDPFMRIAAEIRAELSESAGV